MKIENLKLKIRSGFSIIELVFAMSFLTIIVFGVISLQSSNLAMMNSQNNEIQAHFYANQGLQVVKALGYANITCVTPPCTQYINLNGSYSLGSTPEPDIEGTFRRSVVIDPAGLTDAYKITVEVKWDDSTGDEHEVTAKSIIF